VFKKQPKESNRLIGEISSNLVTLLAGLSLSFVDHFFKIHLSTRTQLRIPVYRAQS
jgi:hypothetical protein